MAQILVSAEKTVNAPADTVFGYVRDMREHPNFLPSAFSDFQVESGGVGPGTITRFTVTAGGRSRNYRMKVDEPEPGRIITESDTGSSLVTKTTVTSMHDGVSARGDRHDLAGRGRNRRLLRAHVRAPGAACHLRGRTQAARQLRPRAQGFLNPPGWLLQAARDAYHQASEDVTLRG